jgi:hypothetical protein
MDPLLSGDHSNPERKGSQYYFKGSNHPSNRYVDLIDSDDEMNFSPDHRDLERQKIIRTGRLTDGPSHFKNRLHSKSKNLSDIRVDGGKRHRSGKNFKSDIDMFN